MHMRVTLTLRTPKNHQSWVSVLVKVRCSPFLTTLDWAAEPRYPALWDAGEAPVPLAA